MPITTRTGDKGLTYLAGGVRVSKNSPCIEAVGTIDELNSCLGMAVNYIKEKETVKTIKNIQKDLFVLGHELVAEDSAKKIKETQVKKIRYYITKDRAWVTSAERIYYSWWNSRS